MVLKNSFKHVSWLIVIGSCLYALSGCNYVKNIHLLSAGKLKRNQFVQEIPFEYRKGIIVVNAQINSDTTLHEFIFDTGAFDGKIEKNIAEQLKMPTKAEKSNGTAAGITRTIEITQAERFTLGETLFSSISMGKLVYNEHSNSPCIASSGIIGANLIKLANWKVDFTHQIIQFSDSDLVNEKSDSIITISFSHPLLSGTPFFSFDLNGVKIDPVLLDLGYNGGIILPDSYQKEFSSIPNASIVVDNSTTGIYGSRIDTVTTKLLELTIEKSTFSLPISFSRIGKALVGTDFLEHFIVYMNYDNNTFSLHSQSEIEIEPQLNFIPKPITDTTWVVTLASTQSSLKLGDTLKTVNEFYPYQVFKSKCDYFYGIKELLKQEDSIRVERINGEKLTLPIWAE